MTMRKVKLPLQPEKVDQSKVDIFKLVDFSLKLGKYKEMLNGLENETVAIKAVRFKAFKKILSNISSISTTQIEGTEIKRGALEEGGDIQDVSLSMKNVFESSFNKLISESLKNEIENAKEKMNDHMINYVVSTNIYRMLDKEYDVSNKETILSMHRELFRMNAREKKPLPLVDLSETLLKKNSGAFKTKDNQAGTMDPIHFISKNEVKDRVSYLIDWINNVKEISIIKNAIVHAFLVGIHPFNDGNGRLARLFTNKLFEKETGVFLPLDEMINIYRNQYVTEMDKLVLEGNPYPFINFIISVAEQQIDRNIKLTEDINKKISELSERVIKAKDIKEIYSNKIASFLTTTMKFNINTFMKVVGVQRNTAKSILETLIRMGHITNPVKIGPHVTYISKEFV